VSAPAGIGRLNFDPAYSHRVRKPTRKRLDALVEQAIVDCYNDDEQLTGLYTMIADNLVTPFSTQVVGVEVTVEGVDLRGNDIVALCARGTMRQAIPHSGTAAAQPAARRSRVDRRLPPLGRLSRATRLSAGVSSPQMTWVPI
jgi:hypothetical protein